MDDNGVVKGSQSTAVLIVVVKASHSTAVLIVVVVKVRA